MPQPETKRLKTVLREAGLSSMFDHLLAEGVADDVLDGLTEAHLAALGLNLGDRIRFQKALRATPPLPDPEAGTERNTIQSRTNPAIPTSGPAAAGLHSTTNSPQAAEPDCSVNELDTSESVPAGPPAIASEQHTTEHGSSSHAPAVREYGWLPDSSDSNSQAPSAAPEQVHHPSSVGTQVQRLPETSGKDETPSGSHAAASEQRVARFLRLYGGWSLALSVVFVGGNLIFDTTNFFQSIARGVAPSVPKAPLAIGLSAAFVLTQICGSAYVVRAFESGGFTSLQERRRAAVLCLFPALTFLPFWPIGAALGLWALRSLPKPKKTKLSPDGALLAMGLGSAAVLLTASLLWSSSNSAGGGWLKERVLGPGYVSDQDCPNTADLGTVVDTAGFTRIGSLADAAVQFSAEAQPAAILERFSVHERASGSQRCDIVTDAEGRLVQVAALRTDEQACESHRERLLQRCGDPSLRRQTGLIWRTSENEVLIFATHADGPLCIDTVTRIDLMPSDPMLSELPLSFCSD